MPTQESLAVMRSIKKFLPEMEARFPEIYGVTFFGSRTLGREKETSDLDMMVFYDGSKWETKIAELEKAIDDAYVSPLEQGAFASMDPLIAGKLARETLDSFVRQRDAYLDSIHDLFVQKVEEMNIPVDPLQKMQNRAVSVIDASPQRLERLFKNFKLHVKHVVNSVGEDFVPHSAELTSSVIFRQLGLLCLSCGSHIQEVRSNLFALYKGDPEGEFYFRMLMKYLEYFERRAKTPKRNPLPTFKHYPKTLTEAKVYFSVM